MQTFIYVGKTKIQDGSVAKRQHNISVIFYGYLLCEYQLHKAFLLVQAKRDSGFQGDNAHASPPLKLSDKLN